MVITDMNIRTGRMESEIKVDTDNETAAALQRAGRLCGIETKKAIAV